MKVLHRLARWVAFFAVLASVRPAWAIAVDVETVGAMSSRNQAAWWSPIAHRDGAVYVSYLSPNSPQDDVFVGKRSGDGTWELRDTGVNAVYDVGHTQTSMAIDGQGYLHVAYGMHNHPMRIVTSNQPLSVAGGFAALPAAATAAFADGKYTYPNMTTAPNGDIYMIVRDQRSSYANQQGRLFRFDDAARTWSELPPFAGQTGTTVYPDHIMADASGDLHIIWEWAAGGAQGARHYGSYARYDPDDNVYYRANGDAYPPGPISVATADIYQGLEGSETFQTNVHGVQSAKMTLDDEGRPMIAYGYSTTGTDSGYQHRFARWTGDAWIHTTITPGPFNIDKSWIAYSGGVLRYYGTVSPLDPLHTGTDDIFLRTSTDLGATWSEPIPVTQGLDVQRPVGITVGHVDYLYLPSTSAGKLYLAVVNAMGAVGDFNGDGETNEDDLGVWTSQYGQTASNLNADGDGDFDVDGADWLIWQRHATGALGAASSSTAAPQLGVPEPSTGALLTCAAFIVVAYLPAVAGGNARRRAALVQVGRRKEI